MSIQIQDKKFTQEQTQLIKNTVAKGCTDDELQLFLYTCSRTGLDPLMKQIHAIKRKTKVGNAFVEVMTMQTSIDGLRSIAERTKCYAPGKETIYQYGPSNQIVSATAFVKKRTDDGTWHEVGATAFFEEYAQRFNGELGKFWKQFGHVMIAKCAEALALRRAFPYELSTLYTTEEMMNPLNKGSQDEELLHAEQMAQEEQRTKEHLEEEKITLDLPKDVDPIDVDRFVLLSSISSKVSENHVRKRAKDNMEKFLSVYREWIVKNPRSKPSDTFDISELE